MSPTPTLLAKIRKLPAWLAWRRIPLTPWGLQMFTNDRRLAALRDCHRGHRAFVIGNGPSLSVDDLDHLEDEITFASNRIYLAFGETCWRPTWLTVCDEELARNSRAELRGLKLPKVYSWEAAAELMPDRHALVIRSLPHPLDGQGRWTVGFSEDLIQGAHGGFSVLYLSLQAAAWMGIREVYLLGVDLNSRRPRPPAALALLPARCSSPRASRITLRRTIAAPERRGPSRAWKISAEPSPGPASFSNPKAVCSATPRAAPSWTSLIASNWKACWTETALPMRAARMRLDCEAVDRA